MYSSGKTTQIKLEEGRTEGTLLIIGPQPPPIGGATVTVQTILDELEQHELVQVITLNTSPSPNHFKTARAKLDLANIKRIALILRQYLQYIQLCDAVLVFVSDHSNFFIVYIPVLLTLAHLYHKPIFVKPFGGALDQYLLAHRKPIRSLLLRILRDVDGIFAQTRQLQEALKALGCSNTYYVPGCRPKIQVSTMQKSDSGKIRLIFLSHIYRQKGVMTLLDALDRLELESTLNICCDFYGPILENRDEVLRRMETTTGAKYCGVAQPNTTLNLISTYDILVLPTYFPYEGHPGAIIEAMQAGVPVISTQHRAIPELITHGENGLLVPVQDSRALAEAIKQMALDSTMRQRMGQENYRRGQEFLPEVVVPQIVNIIFHRN